MGVASHRDNAVRPATWKDQPVAIRTVITRAELLSYYPQ